MIMGGDRAARGAVATVALAATVVCAIVFPLQTAHAQSAPSQGASQSSASSKKASSKAATSARSDDAGGAASGGRSRLDVLEQQMIDMQVAIGTLESFGRGGSGGAVAGRSAAAGIDSGRVDALETQVRALSAQVEQLQRQLQQMQQQGAAPMRVPQAGLPPPVASVQGPQIAPGVQGVPDNDPIGRIIGGGQARANSAIVGGGGGGEAFVLPADASPKQAYETAYGHLLSQDYASAEVAFEEFLKRFPNDQLAGNAQYWLGETFFVRGQFRPAATAFLKGYQTYGRSAKAPDSLLKLGLSLDRLGQKDAACASFGEIASKFPTAPGHIRQRADGERRRLGCG